MLRTYKTVYSWTWTMKALPELKPHLFFYPGLQKPIVIDFLEPSIFQVGAVVAPGGKNFCQKSLSKCKFRPISGLSLLGEALRSHFFPLQSLGHISHTSSVGVNERWEEGMRVRFSPSEFYLRTGNASFLLVGRYATGNNGCLGRLSHVLSFPTLGLPLPSQLLPPMLGVALGLSLLPMVALTESRIELRLFPQLFLEKVWNYWVSAQHWCPDLPFFPSSCLQLYPNGGLESLSCAWQQEVYSLWLKDYIEQRSELGTSFLDHENSWRMDKMRIFISVDLRAFWKDHSILSPPSLDDGLIFPHLPWEETEALIS